MPTFDSQIEGINSASGENEEFGDETGNSVNFTDFTAQKNGTRLQNAGKDVNFLLAWNRPHSGDYALDELFEWIAGIVK